MIRPKIVMGFLWTLVALTLHMLAMAPGAQAQAPNAPRSHNSGRWLKALLLVFLFALASVGRVAGQGSRKDDIVFNSRGVPLAGATVRVCAMPASGQPCTPLAQIFSDAALTQALANPTITDGLGNYFFYAAPGKYEIEFSGPGITTKQIPNVILASDPTSPSFSSISSSGGISAFSLNLTGNLTVNGNTTVVGNLASGTLNLTNQSTAPGAAGTGTVNLYTKTADKRLYYKDDTGTEIGPVANTTGAQTNVTNTFTAQQNFDANIAFKGPNPWFDVTRFGGYSAVSPPSTTGSISSGTAALTLAAAQDFANGQGIVVYGAGAAPAITTPGTPTVTPIGVLNGATTYNYKVVAEDRLGGLTAASAQGSTTTGAATLGVNTVTLTQGARASGITTYTSSANHNLQAGATVNIAGFNSGSGTFFDDMNGVKVVVSTPTGTTFTVNDATFMDRTDTSGGTAQVQACNQLSYGSSSFSGIGTLRYWVYRNNVLVGVVPGMDPFYLDCNVTVGSPPSYVPAAPPGAATPQYLISTIVSGGGTTTLTLANNASTTVSGKTVLHDNSLPLKAAAQAAYNVGGGTVYIPIGAFAANYPFNATTDFTSGMTVSGSFSVRLLTAAALLFNQPIIPRSAMDFEGTPSTTSSFVYVAGGGISGLAHPLFYTGEGMSGVHFNRLLITLGPALQTGFFSDNGADGGGTSGMVFDDVQFLGNNGATRPVVLKGGFDYFFRRGECNSGGATWPVTPCMELTNSSVALVGANPSQLPGRVEWSGANFVNTGVYINGVPNSAASGGTHIAFNRTLFESAVGPFARINMNNSNAFVSQIIFNDVDGADIIAPLATPFIDGTNSPNLQRVSFLDGITAVANQPLYVNGTPGSATTFYVARPPSSVISNVPYTSADTASAQYSNSFASALNGGRFFYQMATPAAPGVAVGAGGSVPLGTQQYQITAVDTDGKESVISSIATASTSSGNQTVTVTPPALPAGAVGWKAYRNQVLANIPGCATLASSATFVDTFSFTCGTSIPVPQAGSSLLSTNGVSTYKLNLSNEVLTASPRAEQNVFLAGALTSTWTAATWTTDKAVTVTRIQVQAKTAPSGCGTNAVVRVTDGTTPQTVTVSAAANDSGALTQNYAAGAAITVSVSTAASGCGTNPADANVSVQYRMQ